MSILLPVLFAAIPPTPPSAIGSVDVLQSVKLKLVRLLFKLVPVATEADPVVLFPATLTVLAGILSPLKLPKLFPRLPHCCLPLHPPLPALSRCCEPSFHMSLPPGPIITLAHPLSMFPKLLLRLNDPWNSPAPVNPLAALFVPEVAAAAAVTAADVPMAMVRDAALVLALKLYGLLAALPVPWRTRLGLLEAIAVFTVVSGCCCCNTPLVVTLALLLPLLLDVVDVEGRFVRELVDVKACGGTSSPGPICKKQHLLPYLHVPNLRYDRHIAVL